MIYMNQLSEFHAWQTAMMKNNEEYDFNNMGKPSQFILAAALCTLGELTIDEARRKYGEQLFKDLANYK